jgi:hypothetical protein
MEKERLGCDIAETELYFEALSQNVTDVPAAFLFNLDESGFRDWADRREQTVVVPSSYTANNIGIPVDRPMKRGSLLICISADGTALKPLLIIRRKTIEKEFFKEGIHENPARLISQQYGFITSIRFNECCREVFVPRAETHREQIQYWERAVLIMDGLTDHESDEIEDFCFEHDYSIQLIPPHSSDQGQPSDVGIFGPMKINVSRIRSGPGLSKQCKQVLRILGALQAGLLPPTVICAFAQAGIQLQYVMEHRYLICSVNRAAARCVRNETTGRSPRELSNLVASERGCSSTA